MNAIIITAIIVTGCVAMLAACVAMHYVDVKYGKKSEDEE